MFLLKLYYNYTKNVVLYHIINNENQKIYFELIIYDII